MNHPDFEKDISFEHVKAYFAPIPMMEVDGGTGILLDDDLDRISQVVFFESCLEQFSRKGKNDRVLINESKVEQCRKKGVMEYDSCMLMSTRLAALFSFFELDEVEFRRSLGDISYSPMVELFFSLYGNWLRIYPREPSTSDTDRWQEFFRAKVSWRNSFLDSLYATMTSKELLERQKSHRRSSKKNYQSACDYVDNLISRRSKVLVLRFDVAYKKYQQHLDMSRLGSSDGITPEQALLDREKFIKLLKKAFSNAWMGYIWKLEYRPRKGYHFHMLVFLDGHKSMFDFNLIDQAGQIWIQEITHGVGVYYNCNRSSYRYLSDGTGMLLRSDKDKMLALKKAVGYLTKIDLLVRSRLLAKRRIFGKGEMVLGSKKTQDVRAALAEQRRAAKEMPPVSPFDSSGRF